MANSGENFLVKRRLASIFERPLANVVEKLLVTAPEPTGPLENPSEEEPNVEEKPAEEKPNEQEKPAQDKRVEILTALPPSQYDLGTLFQNDPRHDLKAVTVSQANILEYRAAYAKLEDPDRPYPLRHHLARHTGMPSFLTGHLTGHTDFESPKAADDIGRMWFQQGVVAPALFGKEYAALFETEPQKQKTRFEWTDTVFIPIPAADLIDEKLAQNQIIAHSRYQQFYGEFPVLGGNLVAHLRVNDERMYCSNSYFPIVDEVNFVRPKEPKVDGLRAKRLAVQAVASLEKENVIGLYYELLRPWLLATDEPKGEWTDFESDIGYRLVEAWGRDLVLEIEILRQSGNLNTEQLIIRLRKVGNELEEHRWQVEFAPLAQSELFILPFAGKYYLAYQVDLVAPNGAAFWSVFVDAHSDTILGEPSSPIAHALPQYYETSGAILANRNRVDLQPPDLAALKTDIAKFMDLLGPSGGTIVPLDIVNQNLDQGLYWEAISVAFHGRDMWRRFHRYLNVPVDVASPLEAAPKLQVQVGMGTNFQTGFFRSNGTVSDTMTFRHDSGTGIPSTDNRPPPFQLNNLRSFNPSFDREVVYHEFAHAFMCKLNQEIYRPNQGQQPFAFALIEGYATFLARTLAARNDFDRQDNQRLLWARGASREAEWKNTWAIARPAKDWRDGADRLRAPNLYPNPETEGMQGYDVGMILARALWDVVGRVLSTPFTDPLKYDAIPNQNDFHNGLELSERLVLNAYFSMHGWIANFEAVSEAIIDGAITLSPNQFILIQGALKDRGIYAERGVQTVTATTGNAPVFFIGSDKGVWRWDGNPASAWQDWSGDVIQPDRHVSDVVALAIKGTDVIAATEHGIFVRDVAGANAWGRNGNWPADRLPLSLQVMNNTPLVGTSQGLVGLENSNWKDVFPASDASRMAYTIFADTPNNTLYISTLGNTMLRVKFMANGALLVTDVFPSLPFGVRGTAIAKFGDELYTATVGNGLMRLVIPPLGQPHWEDVSSALGAGVGLYCIALDEVTNQNQSQLLVGTTAGLARLNLQTNTLENVQGIPQTAIVTCIWGKGKLIVGTLNKGLFVFENNGWQNIAIGGPIV